MLAFSMHYANISIMFAKPERLVNSKYPHFHVLCDAYINEEMQKSDAIYSGLAQTMYPQCVYRVPLMSVKKEIDTHLNTIF